MESGTSEQTTDTNLKVADLRGDLLDNWVRKALGAVRKSVRWAENEDAPLWDTWVFPEGSPYMQCTDFSPSRDRGQAGDVIFNEEISTYHIGKNNWGAFTEFKRHHCYGKDPFEAALRFVVYSNFGFFVSADENFADEEPLDTDSVMLYPVDFPRPENTF